MLIKWLGDREPALLTTDQQPLLSRYSCETGFGHHHQGFAECMGSDPGGVSCDFLSNPAQELRQQLGYHSAKSELDGELLCALLA